MNPQAGDKVEEREGQAGTGTQPVSRGTDTEQLQKNMQEMMTMMQELRLNVLGAGRGRGGGEARGVFQPPFVAPPAPVVAGRGRGGFEPPRRFIPTCYNCGELGHLRNQCTKPMRMGGDMYPLPQQIPNRANDYALDIRTNQGVNQAVNTGNQASTSGGNVGVVRLEKKVADVMPLGKRERTHSGAGPSKKKGKEKEGEDAKAKRKRRPRRKFEVADLPIGDG